MDVISLLRSKNKCLERFLDLCSSYLDLDVETAMTQLGEFETQRESIIKAMELYDRKISEAAALLTQDQKTAGLRAAVQEVLDSSQILTNEILRLDENVMARLEAEKQAIATEMNKSRKSKDVLSKFKSSWVPESGDSLDEKA